MNTFGKSTGRGGNYTTNYQITGRELMTPDEVRMLDNRYALLFMKGERPVIDLKYDLTAHPAIGDTPEKDPSLVYRHGTDEHSVAGFTVLTGGEAKGIPPTAEPPKDWPEYELLTEMDLERLFKEEDKQNEKSQ